MTIGSNRFYMCTCLLKNVTSPIQNRFRSVVGTEWGVNWISALINVCHCWLSFVGPFARYRGKILFDFSFTRNKWSGKFFYYIYTDVIFMLNPGKKYTRHIYQSFQYFLLASCFVFYVMWVFDFWPILLYKLFT